MSLHMSEREKSNKRREERGGDTWHVRQGRFGKEAAFIGKVMKTGRKQLPSVFPFWSGAGKNSHTLLDRTVKAMEIVYSPWRKQTSNAWETSVKLNVRILPTELPGCSALTCFIHIFVLSSWLWSPYIRGKSTDLLQAGPSWSLQCTLSTACGTFLLQIVVKLNNLKFIILTISKWTLEWHQIDSHCCATTTTTHLQNFVHLTRLKLCTC